MGAIASSQRDDPTLRLLPDFSFYLEVWRNIIVDVSNGKRRIILPESRRRDVFKRLYDLARPGARKTLELVSSLYVWPPIRS